MLSQKHDSTPDKSKDELKRLLQEALKKKRPRWLRLALGVTLVAAALLVLLVWLLSSQGEPPKVTVVAFDDLGVAGAKVTLSGRLEAPAEQPVPLQGKDMVFVDGQVLLIPGQRAKEDSTKTGPHGEASCTWTFPPETTQGNFILRQIGDKFRPGMEDRGCMFLVPSGTPLCLVQIDDTLSQAKDQAWRQENIQDIVPVPGAAEALREARQNGYEVVYLALAADRPTLYQKMRGWVRHRSAVGTSPLPAGVVLGRFTLPWEDQDNKPWQKTAARLGTLVGQPQAKGAPRHVAIAGTINVAQQLHAAGIRTLYLGAGDDFPAGVQRLAGWDEVRRVLKK